MSVRIRCWCTTSYCRTISRRAHTQHPNPFPYPGHRNPTPHQIFHLPHSATEAEIKARYYDLVRLYHPDKVVTSSSSLLVSPDEAHVRFQAITAAYDRLRGKTASGGSDGPLSSQTQYQTTAAYRVMQRKRQELYNNGAVDESRMDKWLITGVVATVLFVVVHNLTMRREVIVDAVSRSRALAASESQSGRIREAEERLSMDAVERVNIK